VLREQPYPGQWRRVAGRRRKATALPADSQRQRCDLVLTPRAGQRLTDGLGQARAAEADAAARQGTLFDSTPAPAPAYNASTAEPVGDAVEPEDAYWLEVKLVGQFTYSCGVPGPNPAYASELVRGVGADLRKIRDDPAIIRGGAMLVLLTAGAEVARADAAALIHKLADRGLLVRSPSVAGHPLPDRVGNRWCAVVLLEPTRL
jgi:hypothetical protein